MIYLKAKSNQHYDICLNGVTAIEMFKFYLVKNNHKIDDGSRTMGYGEIVRYYNVCGKDLQCIYNAFKIDDTEALTFYSLTYGART